MSILNRFGSGTNTSLQGSLSSVMAATVNSGITSNVGLITQGYNDQFNSFITKFTKQRIDIGNKASNGLATNPKYDGARSDGVKLAWDYEKADVIMGGDGSAKWDDAQKQEILDSGKVRGRQGHHLKNVADHPEHQANPDNIEILDKDAHHKAHNGNWKDETNSPFIDKDKMLKNTNQRRVIRNELSGLGIAVAIGLGIGFTLGFIVELAKSGVSTECIDNAVYTGLKGSAEAGFMSTLSYGIGRFATNTLQNVGVDLATNIGIVQNMAVVGILTIVVFSTYQFIKLKMQGDDTYEALISIGKQALFSISLLTVSLIAQGIWGGPAGIIVSSSIGLIFFGYSVIDNIRKRELEQNIREYAIEQYKPILER